VRQKKEIAFTLMEVLTVVIIVAILVAIALPSYVGMKEQEHDKEAGANMRLIMAAEKIYRMEMATYCEAATESDLNNILKLSLSTNNKIWDYSTDSSDPASDTCVQATRTSVGLPGGHERIGKVWRFRSTDPEPQYNVGNCP
jgi:Tfp pilus assembly protein PilE